MRKKEYFERKICFRFYHDKHNLLCFKCARVLFKSDLFFTLDNLNVKKDQGTGENQNPTCRWCVQHDIQYLGIIIKRSVKYGLEKKQTETIGKENKYQIT